MSFIGKVCMLKNNSLNVLSALNRSSWVDYAKAIGIILVVYGHVARGVQNAQLPVDENLFRVVDSVIYSFHMPLFFFLSGIFFYDSLVKRGFGGLVLNKVDTLVYPFVLWSLLQGSVEVVLSSYTNGGVTFAEVLSFAWSPRAQFWFLYSLFLVFLVCSLVYSLAGRISSLLLLPIFSVLFLFKGEVDSWVWLKFIFTNTVFFVLGVWFGEVKVFFARYCGVLIFVFGALFLVLQYFFNVLSGWNYNDGGVVYLALAGVSIFFVVSISMCLDKLGVAWLAYIGASSMAIYLMHILAGSGVRVVLDKLLKVQDVSLHLALGTLIGIVAPLLANFVIKHYGWNFFYTPPKALSVSSLKFSLAARGGSSER